MTGDGLPDGPVGFPYLGLQMILEGNRHPIRLMMDNVREYGPVYTTRVLGIKFVWLIGAEANQYVLVENPDNFSWREGMMGEFGPFLGNGLLNTDGERHDRARELMEPAFRPDRLRRYAGEMVHRAQTAVGNLEDGRTIEVYEWTQELALGVATSLLFGMPSDTDLCRRLSRAFNQGLNFYDNPVHLRILRGPFTPYASMQQAREEIDEIVFEEISRRRESEPSDDNILDILVHTEVDGESFSDREVRDQLMHLLFAGHDTTTATVTWMVTLLGRHANVYRRLRDHLDEQLGGGAPDADDLMNGLPYLDQVLDETLRLYPPAWVGPRRAIDDFELYGETIPGGTQVAYCSLATHRLPELYENPAMFDPSRFEPERKRQIPPGGYVPFGRGPRTCIGMNFGKLEIKAIMAVLLQHYDLELLPGQDFTARAAPTLSPRYGVEATVHRRNGSSREPVSSSPTTRSASEGDDEAPGEDCPVHAS